MPDLPPEDDPRPSVVFVCTHNSARSQMAEGYLRHAHGDRFRAFSAGTERTHVRPLAIRAMQDLGIDISTHTSKTLDDLAGIDMDYVITVCDSAREACPVVTAREAVMHESFPDPSAATGTDDERLEQFRSVRDALIRWIDQTFSDTSSPRPPTSA